MNREQIEDLYRDYVMPTYAQGLTLVRGKGVKVWDADGNEYLDFLAGIAVVNLGHSHPAQVRAIRQQAATLLHVSNLYFNEQQAQLAQALAERAFPGAKCFFCNSGAEANEALIKLARLWGHDRGRYEVVTMRDSFDGRTLATLTATGQAKVQKGFEPLPAGFALADFNDLASCRDAVGERTAAILVEAVQGEGGVVPADPAFMAGLRALCDEKDILLLCDEVQCGMGRTGRWFGFQHYGVEPDAFALAKGLGGGFPIGAIVAGPRLAEVFQPGHHASTFGGTPLACAAALAVVRTMGDEDLPAHAAEMGALFKSKLERLARRYPFVEGVRGLGLMVGLVLDRPAAELQRRLQDKGVLALATAGNVLRFVPPLVVRRSHIHRVVRLLREACDEWQAELQTQA